MSNTLILSLCIPTNGVTEWVFPVLESIFAQNASLDKFEVIITDNGNNTEFENKMLKYALVHKNLIYKKTTAFQFLNQIEAFKLARGKFIRFINHRMKMLPGTLQALLDFVIKNEKAKPDIFFSNGALKKIDTVCNCSTFEEYVLNLSYYSSWSAGLGIWKSDFDKIVDLSEYDAEFPHIEILFANRDKKQYIIDNSVVLEEIPVGTISKGKYNLFYAFAVKYPTLLLNLVHDRSISAETFLKLKKDLKEFILDLYYGYVMRHKPCSYDLNGYKDYLDVYYSSRNIYISAFFKRLLKKMVIKIITLGGRK